MTFNCASKKCQNGFRKHVKNHNLVFQALFWSKVKVGALHECWPWQSTISGRGYGCVTINKKCKLAHRTAYELIFGAIPDGMFICHHCDNPPCCNPLHFFVGTNSDNQLDSSRKGRMPSHAGENNAIFGLKGELNPKAKFTQEQANAIREKYKGGLTQKALAKIHNVSQGCISHIVLNKVYKVHAE